MFAGKEGLDAYRELAPQLPRLLEAGGFAAVEMALDQADAVAALLARDGLESQVAADLAGRPRALLVNLGMTEKSLGIGSRGHYIGVRTGPAPLDKLSQPSPPPTQSAVHFALLMRRPERKGQGHASASARLPGPRGEASLRKDVGI